MGHWRRRSAVDRTQNIKLPLPTQGPLDAGNELLSTLLLLPCFNEHPRQVPAVHCTVKRLTRAQSLRVPGLTPKHHPPPPKSYQSVLFFLFVFGVDAFKSGEGKGGGGGGGRRAQAHTRSRAHTHTHTHTHAHKHTHTLSLSLPPPSLLVPGKNAWFREHPKTLCASFVIPSVRKKSTDKQCLCFCLSPT